MSNIKGTARTKRELEELNLFRRTVETKPFSGGEKK
jgi:hypothetical protein